PRRPQGSGRARARRPAWAGGARSRDELRLAARHLVAVVVAEQVEEAMDERPTPFVADHLRTDDDVAELARHALGELVAPVDREREDVGGLVDPQVLALQAAHLVGPD